MGPKTKRNEQFAAVQFINRAREQAMTNAAEKVQATQATQVPFEKGDEVRIQGRKGTFTFDEAKTGKQGLVAQLIDPVNKAFHAVAMSKVRAVPNGKKGTQTMTITNEADLEAAQAAADKAEADEDATPKGKRNRKPQACNCECGGLTNGGRFLPGHDAKLKSKLQKAIRAEGATDAQIKGASDALRALGWERFIPDVKAERKAAEDRAKAAAAAKVKADADRKAKAEKEKAEKKAAKAAETETETEGEEDPF